MTFVEVLELIKERQEIVYTDKANLMRTNQRFYAKSIDGWNESALPEDDKFVAPRKPIEIPVATKKVSTYVSAIKEAEDIIEEAKLEL